MKSKGFDTHGVEIAKKARELSVKNHGLFVKDFAIKFKGKEF